MARDSKSTFYDVVLLLRFFTNNQQFPSSCLFCGVKITSLRKRVIINSPLCRLQPEIFFSIRLLLKSNTLISTEFDRKTLCKKSSVKTSLRLRRIPRQWSNILVLYFSRCGTKLLYQKVCL